MTFPRSSKRSSDGRRSKLEGLMPVLVTRFSKSMKRAMRRSLEETVMSPPHATLRHRAHPQLARIRPPVVVHRPDQVAPRPGGPGERLARPGLAHQPFVHEPEHLARVRVRG